MIHYLKIKRKWFTRIDDGSKTFEVRTNDRDFQVGDRIKYTILEEDKCNTEFYLNDRQWVIMYIHSGLGLDSEYVVFSIKEIVK